MIYDPESNLISIEVSKGKIEYARDFGNFIIHFSEAGKPLLIEILDASKFIGQLDKINISNIKELKSVKLAN